MRTQQIDLPRQTVSTRNAVPVTADTEIFIRVTDAKKVFLEADEKGDHVEVADSPSVG